MFGHFKLVVIVFALLGFLWLYSRLRPGEGNVDKEENPRNKKRSASDREEE